MVAVQLKYIQYHIPGMSLESWSRSRATREDSSADKNDRRHRERRYDESDRGDHPYRDRDRVRSYRDSRDLRRQDRDRGHGNDYRHNNDRGIRQYYGDDRESRRHREKRSSRRYRSRSRSSSTSYDSRSKRSRSSNTKTNDRHRTSSSVTTHEAKNINIIRASRSRSKSKSRSPDKNRSDRWKNDYNFESMYRSEREPPPPIIGNLDEHFDKEKIHKQMQERLTQHLAREGKVYPPPKPQASHPIFANDGSFLETFKKLQQQQQHHHNHQQQIIQMPVEQILVEKKPIPQPIYGKRRGVKILKTGIVAKQKVIDETSVDTPNDTWAIYLQEVKKYKNVSCDADTKTRPLVK